MPKIRITCTLFLLMIFGVHTTALAEVQLGLEAQFINDQLSPDTAKINWWLTDHWALGADYVWGTEEIGLNTLFIINPKSSVALYLGLAANDVTGDVAPELTLEEKAALIAGLDLDLSPGRSGLSLMVEAEIAARKLLDNSGAMNGPAPRVSLSLNYRFPSAPGPAANTAETDQTTDLLAKLITLEARNEPFEGQVAVAAVVLNRTRSKGFPGSVREVIYQPGQFQPAGKLKKTVPSASAVKAARAALRGSDPSRGALYFYNPARCSEKTRAYFKKYFQVTTRIGRHVFVK